MEHHDDNHKGEGGTGFWALPEALVESVLSLTSPLDASRLTSVSSSFKSAADSDAVWARFLPSDYPSILERAIDPVSVSLDSFKELYLGLSNGHVLIDDGTMSFSLDGRSGKKCYMLSARALSITWGGTPQYWKWISMPESRFPEVAELISVCWLDIHGKMNLRMLSPGTNYAAYLVFKSGESTYGFDSQAVEVAVVLDGGEYEERSVYLDPVWDQDWSATHSQTVARRPTQVRRILRAEGQESMPSEDENKYPKERKDGWLEVELGEFFSGGEGEGEGEVEMRVKEVKGLNWKGGIIVQGIEIRPKDGK